jgi:hypothetical protein
MRLTRIEIENFKGIGSRQRIDLRPITLLFGPNSAGKSTILQALHYLREILERGNVDPDRTIAGGLIDLGGFAKMVHNHELNRPIRIGAWVQLLEDETSERLPLHSGIGIDAGFASLPLRYFERAVSGFVDNSESTKDTGVNEVGLLIEIRWSDLLAGPYVSRLTAELNGEAVADIVSPPQPGRARVCNFRFAHPLLVDSDLDDVGDLEGSEDVDQSTTPSATALEQEIEDLSRAMAGLRSPTVNAEKSVYSQQPAAIREQLQNLASELRRDSRTNSRDDEDDRESAHAVAVETRLGALPDIERPLQVDLRDIDPEEIADASSRLPAHMQVPGAGKSRTAIAVELRRRQALGEFLDEVILGPARVLRDALEKMTYIGPLREIPSRNFSARRSPDHARWAHGLAAWDLLYNDRRGDLMNEVNVWLSGEERLRTTYRLERVEFKEIPVPSAIHQMFERGLNEDDIGDLQELYLSLSTRTEIALRDFEKGILVAPGDVGVGISQMVPVIVASLRKQDGVLGIEQPELHVHPAIQVGMGDLFIKAATRDEDKLTSGKTLLIETHSEHIMLRLLRRVREQTEGEVPPGVLGLTPDDLSVIYVESSVEGVRFRPLRVSPDGDFVDRWPHGFFAERAEELF